MMTPDEKDKLMDHEYDGIQEFDNNLPGWWLYGFYFTIVFAVVYILAYHVYDWAPLPEEEYREELQAAYNETKMIPAFMDETGGLANYHFQLLTDVESIEAGKKLFTSNKALCYTCHGPEGQGLVGPNLTDGYWMNGCDPEKISKNIITGFPDKGMVPFGSGARMSNKEVNQLVAFIVSIKGTDRKSVV